MNLRVRVALAAALLWMGAGPLGSGRAQDVQKIADALTKGSAPGKSAPAGKADAPATKDAPDENVAEAAGPIAVENKVDDFQVQERLQELLPEFPGVRKIHVRVRNGVATLSGHVEDEEVRDRVRDFARRVEGVSLVINQTRTDSQVLTAQQRVLKKLGEYRELIARTWLLAVLALGILFGSIALARLFNRYSETLLVPVTDNVLLRSVLGSVLGGAIMLGGLFAALGVLGLTEAVLSIVGLAGVVALAVGFAFRDITENFIASILLGVRRPFRVGDYVTVAGHAGVVKSLNTRATVLVTLEGNHVRIPNSAVFKEVLVNSSASDSTRGTFDVLIPYEVSTAAATEAIGRALREHDGILADPPARALVEALESNGVRLRSYFWYPTRGVDGFKLMSDARLKAKVALQQAGIAPPSSAVALTVAGHVPVEVIRDNCDLRDRPQLAPRPGTAVTAEQARANLMHDARAADRASAATVGNGHANGVQHVLNNAQDGVSEEGDNLLEGQDDAK